MMILTTRQYQIIRLLKESISSVPSFHLCGDLGISPRTLRYDICAINKQVGSDLIRSSRDGYSIDANLDLDTRFGSIKLSSYSITAKSLAILLLENESIALHEIREKCFISNPVIESLLRQISSQLDEFDLQVVRSGKHISLRGTEFSKRQFLIHLLFSETYDESSFCPDHERYFVGFELSDVFAIVRETLEDLGIFLDDIFLKHICISTAVSLQRIMDGHITKKQEFTIDIERESIIYPFLTSLLERIYNKYKIKVGEEDFRSLLRAYIGSFTENCQDSTKVVYLKDDGLKDNICKILNDTMQHFRLSVNWEPFLDRFVMHISFLLRRAKAGSFVKTQIAASLRQSNPFVHEVAIYMAYLLQIKFNVVIPDEEIGLLAILLGSIIHDPREFKNRCDIICVCPKYNDLRDRIASQILNLFGTRINIIRFVSSYSDISEEETYDFIISTISNTYSFKDIVYVSPLIGPWEYQRINAKIIESIKRRQKNDTKDLLLKYSHADLFFYDEPYLEDMKILHFIDDRMKSKGIVGEDFLMNVLKREKLASTAFSNRFAIPHAMNSNAKETRIAYYYSNAPINWFGSNVNLVLMMATKENDKEFIRLYELIIEILMDNFLYYKLTACNRYEAMVDFVINHY